MQNAERRMQNEEIRNKAVEMEGKKRRMRNVMAVPAVVIMGVMFISAGEKMTGDDLAKKFDERLQPKTMSADMRMKLTDKKGNERVRKTKTVRQGDEKMLMWFESPADVKGVSFLRKSYDDRDDDMWIYLPAFGKVRRIASHAKGGNFMGTDFTYEDMGERKVRDYTYEILKEEEKGNKECWVLEWKPKEGVSTDYSKIISWMWKENYQPIVEEFYNKAGEKSKVKVMDVEKRGKYWLPVSMAMKDIKNDHKTEIVFDRIKTDISLNDSVFTTNFMQRVR